MKAKKPKARRKFAGPWDEIDFLYRKLLYWLYERESPGRARRYIGRLERLLSEADPNREAIIGEECRSLIHEAKGDLKKAIEYRENEIRSIRRLRKISRGKPHAETVLAGYGWGDLSDRLDLLATLYRASGDLDKALAVLEESEKLCSSHGIPFDGEDLLREYRKEKGNTRASGRRSLQ
jgi:tetratricopeptide (TPR) repeat protein